MHTIDAHYPGKPTAEREAVSKRALRQRFVQTPEDDPTAKSAIIVRVLEWQECYSMVVVTKRA
jgi:hypothetical protein